MDDPLLWEKCIMTVLLLLITLFFTFLPWILKGSKNTKANVVLLSLCTCLAGGVIIGALLFHLIPETLIITSNIPEAASENNIIHIHSDGTKCDHHHSHDDAFLHIHEIHGQESYHHHNPFSNTFQWGSLAFGLSFFGLLAIDRLFLAHRHCLDSTSGAPAQPKAIPSKQPFSTKENPLFHNNNHHHHNHENHHHHHSQKPHRHNFHHQSNPCISHANSGQMNLQDGPIILQIPTLPDCHSVNAFGGCHVEGLEPGSSKVQSLFFVLALSVHSFIEGLAAHSIYTSPALISFAVSLFSHKFLEALALGISVYKSKFSYTHTILLGVIYSLLTPFGIILSLWLYEFTSSGPVLPAVLNGLAAGSFLFVAVVEMIIPELHTYSSSTPAKFLVLLVGFFGMAAVSLFPHTH